MILTPLSKRFEFDVYTRRGVKLHTCCHYPRVLTLSPALFYSRNSTLQVTYPLHGIICHHGLQVEMGHYTALTRQACPTMERDPSLNVNPYAASASWVHYEDTRVVLRDLAT